MSFDYEKSIWGKGVASLRISDPANVKLRRALIALKEVPEGGRILEIGCGAGQFIKGVKKYRPDLVCFGSDISNSALLDAKKESGTVEFILQESYRTPFEDESFDAVLVFDVLEHVDNPAGLLAEVRRVLKKGGIFFSYAPCEGDKTSMWNLLRKMQIGKDLTKKYAGHIQYFSRESISEIIGINGFKIVELSYSEHILGQFLGIAVFSAMALSDHNNDGQLNNEKFFSQSGGKFRQALKKVINGAVSVESEILKKVPSPNLFITAVRE